MLSKIVGAISILMGFIWFVKPQILQNRLKRKMNRRLKWIVFGFTIMFGFLIIASVIKAPGLLSKIVGIIGLVIVVKGILLVTSKASEKMLDWVATKPLHIFRIWGLIILVIGVMLILS